MQQRDGGDSGAVVLKLKILFSYFYMQKQFIEAPHARPPRSGSDSALEFRRLLAVHAASGLGRGLESGHRDVGSALGAMAKASGVYARQSIVQGTQLSGLAFIQG